MTDETSYLYVIHPPTRTFTGTAKETITVGDFVKATDNDDAVAATSGYAPDDIYLYKCNASGDDQLCVGIALTAASTGGYLGVAMNGVFVVKSGGDIGAGIACQQDDSGNSPAGVKATVDTEEEYTIGKTLTSASADGKYMVFALNV